PPVRPEPVDRESGPLARRVGRRHGVSGSAAAEVRPPARSDARAVRRRRATTWMPYAFLLALAVVFLFPFVIAIIPSFKTDPNATANPLAPRPSPATTARN